MQTCHSAAFSTLNICLICSLICVNNITSCIPFGRRMAKQCNLKMTILRKITSKFKRLPFLTLKSDHIDFLVCYCKYTFLKKVEFSFFLNVRFSCYDFFFLSYIVLPYNRFQIYFTHLFTKQCILS